MATFDHPRRWRDLLRACASCPELLRLDLAWMAHRRGLEAGRCALILTERRDYVEMLRARSEPFTRNLAVLPGGLKSAELGEAQAGLRASANDHLLGLATGSHFGEGRTCSGRRITLGWPITPLRRHVNTRLIGTRRRSVAISICGRRGTSRSSSWWSIRPASPVERRLCWITDRLVERGSERV